MQATCGLAYPIVFGLALFAQASSTIAEPIQALGVERCNGRQQRFTVAFIAPESTPIQVLTKAKRGGITDESIIPQLSLDGKPCSGGRCALAATRGQTYSLLVDGVGLNFDDLCVSVQRP